MSRLRFRTILVLFPLLFVWIIFQVSLYNRRDLNVKNVNRRFTFKRLNSSEWRSPKFVHKQSSDSKFDWVAPDIFDKSYDDDLHEIVKPLEENTKMSKKLWFMSGGHLRPEEVNINVENKLWPEQNGGDRIIEQLMYVPGKYSNEWNAPSPLAKLDLYDLHRSNLKYILLIGDFVRNQMPPGRSIFWQEKCPVNTCSLVSTLQEARNTDAVLFKGPYLRGIDFFIRRRPHHVWILYLLESAANTGELNSPKHAINWTASYRHDSDIVTPYGKFVPYNSSVYVQAEIKMTTNPKNYAANKSKKVAWFVSNCDAKNDRLQYALILSRYIEVDIYGSCGTKKCSRATHSKCLEMLDESYKFYLSFENSNCREYITEKFFENGLGHNVLPIVMGPPREDYVRVAPHHSFIHVNDFASPKELAGYLNVLDTNDTLYNQYFAWKGTGEFINTHFWCRLCAMLHAPHGHKSYEDVQKWWSGSGVCEA